MKKYKNKTLTVDNLEKNESGSIFEKCIFKAGAEKKVIEEFNFSYAAFNDCKFETRFVGCNMMNISGNSLPGKEKVENCNTRNIGDSKLREKWLQTLPGIIELTTDAKDSYQPHEGIPDIPADGESTCSIIIKKKNAFGEYCTSKADNDQIDIDCTRGSLSTLRINLIKGTATIKLTSIKETCLSTVSVYGSDKNSPLNKQQITIQFAPTSQ